MRHEEYQVGKLAGYLTIASKIASKSSEAFEKSKFKDLLETLAPWSKQAADVLGAVGAPLKILGFALQWVTKETDPVVVAGIACTLGYEKAVEAVLEESAGPERAFGEVQAQLALIDTGADLDMSTFSLQTTLSHPFITQAESHFRAGASLAGYTQAQIDSLTPRTRDSFSSCLDQVLAGVRPERAMQRGGRFQTGRFQPPPEHAQTGCGLVSLIT
jgi:hypothetical protein